MASPRKKTARMVLSAKVVEPKTSDALRIQQIS